MFFIYFRCKLWVNACGRSELQNHSASLLHKNFHVCDLHFHKSYHLSLKKLTRDAVPYLYSLAQEQQDEQCSQTSTDSVTNANVAVDADADDGPSSSTGNKKIQNISGGKRREDPSEKEFKRFQGKLKRLLIESKCAVDTDLLTLIDFHIKMTKLRDDDSCGKILQMYALYLYLKRPKTYKVIRASLKLPSVNFLRRTKLENDPGISSEVVNCLQSKLATFNDKDKYCTICLKKMPLKRFLYYHINRDKVIGFHNIGGMEIIEPATHAYVLMARGLSNRWEQLVGYCFLAEDQNSENINHWLDGWLSTLIRVGYNVVCVVVDHEDLYEQFRNRITSLTQPYFHVDGNKIYCIFDLPQLIISLRNTLMAHELQFLDDQGSSVEANWKTVKALHSGYIRDNYCVLVPKLTKAHVDPDESEKKQLKYAAQVFSKSVSAALDMENKRRADNDCKLRGTQILTALVNDIFDILNSSAVNHHNKRKNAFTGEPFQMKTIRRFMDFLTNVKAIDCDFEDSTFNCMYGLRITIMSFSIILRDLLPKGITSLVTHRFNLGAIDTFFDLVRQKSKCENPTPIQLYKYFRQTFMIELMKCPKASKADDLKHFLGTVEFTQLSYNHMKTDEFQKTIEVKTVDYRFELPDTDRFLYICWYLLKKCYETHTCRRSNSFLIYHLKNNADLSSCNWESYFEPPAVFVNLIHILNGMFIKHFGNKVEVGLGTGILIVLKDLKLNLKWLCECFPLLYLNRLFVRMRIFQVIRYNNSNFHDNTFCFSTALPNSTEQ